MNDVLEYINDKFTMDAGLCSHIITDVLYYISTRDASFDEKKDMLDELLYSLNLTKQEKDFILKNFN